MIARAGKICFLAFILVFNCYNLAAQQKYTISGRVIDAETREPLAFVNIVQTGTRTGISTDIDGKFILQSTRPVDSILLTYVGYFPLQYPIPSGKKDNLLIALQSKTIDLNEVVILPTINPAHRIIDSVLANRYRNDPEQLQSFSYTSYEK
ncbi:MAG: carboxypeptidase-like regulatory domain-containing protein, partial [Bacteroidales bacterium]|nr:carboxypeptidase-like regulatory domain-containing protein [Bacteroidales bacterium]